MHRASDELLVTGGQDEAAILNGVYVRVGEFCGRPHYAKDGLPIHDKRYGLKENLQIWWHDGEWRVGNTGDHWFVLPVDTPMPVSHRGSDQPVQQLEHVSDWSPKCSRGVTVPIRIFHRTQTAEEHGKPSPFLIFAAGATSGLIADAVTHPIDTIRTRLWVQGAAQAAAVRRTSGTAQGVGVASAMAERGAVPYQYKGLVNGILTMVRKEGVASLFRGFGSVALLTPLAHGLYFWSYEGAKRVLTPKEGSVSRMSETSAIMSAGFFANTVGALVWNPMDVVKQKQQANAAVPLGPLAGLRSVYEQGGLRRGLMLGYFSGLATYGPFSAIYFLSYERFKSICQDRGLGSGAGGRELGTRHFVAGGFLAGCVAAVATAPIDLIKTRIQVCQGYDGGIADIGRRILREEGLGAFTKGLGARVVWVAPGCAVTIGIFEDVVKVLTRAQESALQEQTAKPNSS